MSVLRELKRDYNGTMRAIREAIEQQDFVRLKELADECLAIKRRYNELRGLR